MGWTLRCGTGWRRYNLIHMLVRSIPLFTGLPSLVRYAILISANILDWNYALTNLIRIVSYIPERYLLWFFPQGQVFNEFKRVSIRSLRPGSEYVLTTIPHPTGRPREHRSNL